MANGEREFLSSKYPKRFFQDRSVVVEAFGLTTVSRSSVLGLFRGGDGVDGGVMAIEVRRDRSSGD